MKMKKQSDPIPASYRDRVHAMHYLHMGNTTLHKPYADKNGIHCAGDRFGYIVDWQLTEKKSEHLHARHVLH